MNDPSYYLRRAHKRLHAAETLMANDESPEDVINRLYYAAREAALAIMVHLDVDVDKMPRTHRGLRALSHQEVVQKGLMDPNWNRELTRLHRHREQADSRRFGGHMLEGIHAVYIGVITQFFNLHQDVQSTR